MSGSLDEKKDGSLSDENTQIQRNEQQPNSPIQNSPVTDEYPEGGLRAWLTVLGAYVDSVINIEYKLILSTLVRFIIQFCGFGYVVANRT